MSFLKGGQDKVVAMATVSSFNTDLQIKSYRASKVKNLAFAVP